MVRPPVLTRRRLLSRRLARVTAITAGPGCGKSTLLDQLPGDVKIDDAHLLPPDELLDRLRSAPPATRFVLASRSRLRGLSQWRAAGEGPAIGGDGPALPPDQGGTPPRGDHPEPSRGGPP